MIRDQILVSTLITLFWWQLTSVSNVTSVSFFPSRLRHFRTWIELVTRICSYTTSTF